VKIARQNEVSIIKKFLGRGDGGFKEIFGAKYFSGKL
jgi:hypothetical protein